MNRQQNCILSTALFLIGAAALFCLSACGHTVGGGAERATGPQLGKTDIPVVAACRALIKEGQKNEALLTCQVAVQTFANDSKALFLYGLALLQNADPAAALAQFERVQGDPPLMALARYYSGVGQSMSGNLDKGAEDFRKAVALYPNFVQAHLGLGHISIETESLTAAAEHYQAALRIDPHNIEGLMGLAWAHILRQHWKEASLPLLTLLQGRPEHGAATELLAAVRAREGAYPAARELLERLYTARQLTLAGQLELVHVCEALGDPAAAASVAETALQQAPQEDRDRIALAELHVRLVLDRYALAYRRLTDEQNAWAQAVRQARQAGTALPPAPQLEFGPVRAALARLEEHFPRQSLLPNIMLLRGLMAAAAGQYDAAEEFYRKILQTAAPDDPTSARAVLQLAELRLGAGRFHEAAKLFQQAAAGLSEPEAGRARYKTAWCLYRHGQPQEALTQLAAELAPAAPPATTPSPTVAPATAPEIPKSEMTGPLRADLLALAAAILADDDWDGDGRNDNADRNARVQQWLERFGTAGADLRSRMQAIPAAP